MQKKSTSYLKYFFYSCTLLVLVLNVRSAAQTYACTKLSISREHNGVIRHKSYVVSGLYLKFTPDSIKVFGNYSGRYISNVLKITHTAYDTIYADGGFFKDGTSIKITLRNNILTSNYDFVDNTGESKVSLILELNSVQNQFSEKYHEKKELEQSQSLRRDLLGREKK